MRFRHQTAAGADQALIRVAGLQREVRVWHLTDSHTAVCDQRDPEAMDHAEKFGELFRQRTPGQVPSTQLFDESLAAAQKAGVDALALSGDIVHFPSRAGIERMRAGAEGLGVPWLFAPGNHDWHFPHLTWGNQTRADHYGRFGALAGGTPAMQCLEVGGVLLVALDNSVYQVDAAQVEFLETQLRRGLPCLLFVHIPFFVESLMPEVLERWKAPIVMGAPDWTDEARAQWKTGEDGEATRRLGTLVRGEEADNLAAVFCGHVHFSHIDPLAPGRVQYVGAPGFEGGQRLIRLLPEE